MNEGDNTADVAHQQHYEAQKIQPIQYLQNALSPEEFRGYLKGNVIKYLSRAERKNGAQDYQKAAVYARWLEEFTRTGKITV